MAEDLGMQVIGLDLSLSNTGLADAAAEIVWSVKPNKLRGYERMRWITTQVVLHCAGAGLVVVEGPSYESKSTGQAGHHERAGLWWFVTGALDELEIPLIVASPSGLKKYATGKGNANKDEVLVAATRRFYWFAGNNDQADALWLSAMGYDLVKQSVVQMPEKHREALKALEPNAA